TTLDELSGQPASLARTLVGGEVLRQVAKGRIEKADQRAERVLLARMRGCGDEDQAPGPVGGELGDELVPLMATAAASAGVGAGVRLIDDHELGAGANEVVAPAVGLDVVGRDDGERIPLEQRLADAETPLKP